MYNGDQPQSNIQPGMISRRTCPPTDSPDRPRCISRILLGLAVELLLAVAAARRRRLVGSYQLSHSVDPVWPYSRNASCSGTATGRNITLSFFFFRFFFFFEGGCLECCFEAFDGIKLQGHTYTSTAPYSHILNAAPRESRKRRCLLGGGGFVMLVLNGVSREQDNGAESSSAFSPTSFFLHDLAVHPIFLSS